MALELRQAQASGAKDTNCFYHLVYSIHLKIKESRISLAIFLGISKKNGEGGNNIYLKKLLNLRGIATFRNFS